MKWNKLMKRTWVNNWKKLRSRTCARSKLWMAYFSWDHYDRMIHLRPFLMLCTYGIFLQTLFISIRNRVIRSPSGSDIGILAGTAIGGISYSYEIEDTILLIRMCPAYMPSAFGNPGAVLTPRLSGKILQRREYSKGVYAADLAPISYCGLEIFMFKYKLLTFLMFYLIV